MSEVTYEWNSRDCDLDEYKNGKYTTCYSGQDIADEMNDYRRALTNSNNRTKDLERQLAEYKTKEQKRNGASLNELMTWSVKELAELVVDLNDEHEDFESQLEEAREFAIYKIKHVEQLIEQNNLLMEQLKEQEK